MAAFVQLMHPGPEPDISPESPNYCPPADRNLPHRRKFMRTDKGGTYVVDPSGEAQTGQFTFWGEWELASNVQQVGQQNNEGMPLYIHTPIWPDEKTKSVSSENNRNVSTVGAGCNIAGYEIHSTDPFVFCEPMHYFCCHIAMPNGILNNLKRGDIVAFGSHLQGNFVLDTLFVVAERVNHDSEKVCSLFRQVNYPYFSEHPQVYLGATHSNPVVDNGVNLFSYFPAQLFDNTGPRSFRRPTISNSSLINPALMMNFNHTIIPNGDSGAVWSKIAETVIHPKHGCVLGLTAR
jgi:hypothetical protein